MTRAYNDNIHCPACGTVYTAETDFERWMRNDPELDSKEAGIVRFDLDVLIHKYMVREDKKGSRDIQCVMFVEVKTHDGEPSRSQRDTLSMLSQVLRNRKRNMYRDKLGRHACDHVPPASVYSHILSRRVSIRLFGGHLLQLSGTDPVNSERIRWDEKKIDLRTLKRLLLFELDPDNPIKKIDWRRRSSAFRQGGLELCGLNMELSL